MNVIWKFPLLGAETQHLEMPKGAVPLHVGEQGGKWFLWARVDPTAPKAMRHITILGTGHAAHATDLIVHIGTFFTDHGAFVWHVFDGGERDG